MGRKKEIVGDFNFEDLLNNTSEGMAVISKQECIWANKAFCKIFGYTKKEIIGSRPDLVFEDDDLLIVQKSAEKILKGTKKLSNYIVNARKKEGKNIIVEITENRIKIDNKIKILLSIRDVTKREKIKQKIKESELKFKKFFDNALDGVIIINASGTVMFANKSAAKMSSYSKNGLIGRNITDLIHPDDKEIMLNRFARRLRRDKITRNYVFRGIDKKGNIKIIEYNGISIVENDKVVGVQVILRDITDKEFYKKSLKEKKDYYKNILNAINDGICVINKKSEIVGFNKEFKKNINLPSNQIINEHCKNIIPVYKNSLFKNHCAENHCDRVCMVDKVFKERRKVSFVEEGINNKNKKEYHRISLLPIKNNDEIEQVVFVITDITKRVKAEEKAKYLSNFNKKIIDNVPVSIVTLDTDLNIISTNNYFKKISGAKNRVGENITDIGFFQKEGLIDKYKNLLHNGIIFSKENCHTLDKNGEDKYLYILAVPLKDKNGKINGVLSLAFDNTEAYLYKKRLENLNKDLEDRVVNRTWRLEELNKELKQVLELKTKFLADASHELRTPLTVIQGNIELILNDVKSKDSLESIKYIRKEIKRMTKILNDLSMLTDTRSTVESFNLRDINIDKLIKIAVKSLKILSDKKNISIDYKRECNNCIIDGDENKIENMLLNIIGNAIKYSKKNSKINIKLSSLKDYLIITVTDRGVGIDNKDLPLIFERFYRGDRSRNQKNRGTGLGLAISKWVVEAHGGFINVKSTKGRGTEFVINLPGKIKK